MRILAFNELIWDFSLLYQLFYIVTNFVVAVFLLKTKIANILHPQLPLFCLHLPFFLFPISSLKSRTKFKNSKTFQIDFCGNGTSSK